MGKLGNFHGKQSCKVSGSRLKRPEQRETDSDCNVEKELPMWSSVTLVGVAG
jgi:hypothetical protein